MRKSIPGLTGVRGVAALWVVFYHLQDMGGHEARLAHLVDIRLFREGFRGVDLFFLLSGFILMYVHQADFLVLRRDATKRFLIGRFWRVYPLNAIVLALIIALGYALPAVADPAQFTPLALVQSFTLAQRWFISDFGAINGPAWSLSVEVVGYAVFPLIAFLLNRLQEQRILACLAVLLLTGLVLASLPLHFADANVTGRLGLLRMFPAFIAGAALALMFLRSRTAPTFAQHSRQGGILATVSLIAIVAVCSVPSLAWLAVIPTGGLVLGLAYENGFAHRLMACGAVVFLGKISFSLYLTHFVALGLFAFLTGNPASGSSLAESLGMTAFALTWVLVAAAAAYYLFERPIAQFSRQMTGRTAKPAG
jgi:peptidoglycan/LPS O-acetylase OafA/YrhL